MSNTTYFVLECPTCGRNLEVRVEYLGKRVACQHCRGKFVAEDPATLRRRLSESSLLRRAERLLELAAQRRPQTESA